MGLVTLFSPLAAEIFGLGSHGVIYGTITFNLNVGAAFGAVLTGWIFDVIGSYDLAFLICAVLGVAAIVLTVSLRPVIGGERGTRGMLKADPGV